MFLIGDDGVTLNARIDINSRDVILHSRSGKTRNRDYRSALKLLLTRLDGARTRYEIFLDSEPVQKAPLSERRLMFDRAASVKQRFDELVRAMNAGTQSHGAWRGC
jgi:5-methylcytosine-specific restriction protein A